jgi:hypothetical protein
MSIELYFGIVMLQTAGMNPNLSGEARWDPSTGNLKNIYRIDSRLSNW